MSERFFLDTPPAAGRALLRGDEARHLARVMRARAGDAVVLFAGTGVEWPARVLRIGRDEVELETDPPRAGAGPGGPAVTLAVALPKGDRQKWLVEKLTELGVARLVPLVTDRGVAEASPAAVERLRRGVIEACKQSGRNTLMEIGEPRSVAEAVVGRPSTALALVAQPGAEPCGPVPAAVAEIVVLIGPEGGFTPDEVARATAAGCRAISLGPHVLRVETAAVAAAARFA